MSDVEHSAKNSTSERLDAAIDEIFTELKTPPVDADGTPEKEAETVAEEAEPETEQAAEAVKSEDEAGDDEESTEAISEEEPNEKPTEFKMSEEDVLWQDSDGNDVTFKSAKDQQMLHADYTRKRQKEASEHRDALESYRDMQSQIKRELDYLDEAARAPLAQYQGIDWVRLQAQDPAKYQQLAQGQAKAISNVEAVTKARAERISAFETQANTKRQQEAESAVAVLKGVIPDWSTDYYADMGQRAAKSGLPLDTFNNITDPNLILMIRKALQYDEIMGRDTKTVSKQVKKTSKPKINEKKSTRATKRKRAADTKAMKSGRVDDWAKSDRIGSIVDDLFN